MNAQNQILTSLSADVRDRLAPHCNSVALAQGELMYQPGETLTQLYFPINCLFSVTITMQDGATAEVGMVGRREVCGHSCLSQQPGNDSNRVYGAGCR
jgi:CRP-like cAMP-binding protein